MRRALKNALTSCCLLISLQACGDDDGPSNADRGGSGGRGEQGGPNGRDAGTDDDDGGTATREVTLQFKAKLGDEDLECGREYPDQGSTDQTAMPQDFRFFVQEASLIARNGDEVPIAFDERPPFQTKEVVLIDFTNGDGHCTTGGTIVNTILTGKVPEGDYTGVVFVNGVPESRNHQNIAVAKAPLQDASTHWGWQGGYRFIMAELRPTQLEILEDAGIDEHEDAGVAQHGGGGVASSIHVGSLGCSGSNAAGYTCTRSNRNRVRLSGWKPSSVIVADLGRVFANSDLHEPLECHGPSPACSALYARLGVDLDSGEPLDTQAVFRLE
jgi:uncharacterized repeat protein (TIGR04052 family)